MTSYVLTIIGQAEYAAVEPLHIERVWQCFGITGRVDWLAADEACDLFFESALSAADLTAQALDALSGTALDAVCIPTLGRRKKLLISDMDSTIINQECIDELGDAIGVGSQIREITAAVIRGDISFSDALRQRLALMKGMDRDLLEVVYESRISLQSGALTFVQTMRHHGAFSILVSGGFSFFTRRIAALVGFHDHQGNELAFIDGKLTGQVLEPILGRTAKLNTMARLCEEKGLTPFDVLAVGDGANDIKMIQAAG
ncbi:MAG: phosphoserine phosphatase SerB, partial [Alphaproteobacteria bacterium]